MRRVIFILLCLLVFVAPAADGRAASSAKKELPLSASDELLRDSILRTCLSMTDDAELRVDYLHKVLWQNIAKKWTAALLDTALTMAVNGRYEQGEIDIRYDYYRYYKFRADTAQMNRMFRELEAACRKHEKYDKYFMAWGDKLQFKTVRGDTESVIMEAKRMGEEARRLNNHQGIFYSWLTEARALNSSENFDVAIEKYREILKLPGLSKLDKALVYNEIALIYQMNAEYNKAISELEKQRSMVVQAIKEDNELVYMYKERMLDLELSFCQNYLALAATAELKKHLDQADRYYEPEGCLFSFKIAYHTMWAGYYYLKDDWNACFREFDLALSFFDGTQPLYEMSVMLLKGQALEYAGRYEDAARNYRRGATEMDSLNRDILRMHEEAHQANYTIRQTLLDKATAERRYNMLMSVLVLVSVAALLALLVRAIYVRRELLRSGQQTREALETVEATNKMKEVFLRNITFQIRVPLNLVVGFADVLTSDKELAREQIQEYAALIKKNAERLSRLIFDILELSRLESGMMKFHVEECDVVQLCLEANMMVEMEGGNVEFNTTLSALPIPADAVRFRKMLVSVLAPVADDAEASPVKYTLMREADEVKISVQNSPLLRGTVEVEQDAVPNRILHDINRLYLEAFNGTYRIVAAEQLITITYPIGKKHSGKATEA